MARRERVVPRDARETRERRERDRRPQTREKRERARMHASAKERASESRRLNKVSGEGNRESGWVISGHPLRGAGGERSDTVSDHSARDRQASVSGRCESIDE